MGSKHFDREMGMTSEFFRDLHKTILSSMILQLTSVFKGYNDVFLTIYYNKIVCILSESLLPVPEQT
ncbi:hypothetical protein KDI_53680 [Dictyobacter arantiisoli]|uniref:Uncharacterized protein n=1 Tax=Dictyobacter arantiisoli TaxID=2014874 RepID=A0A5A5TLF3_9CHLR|nr:hypothetical protein KDI_53680 [Dictyobacter arantiisoli]